VATIKVEQSGPVRTVVLTRADKRNAMNAEMLDALLGAFRAQPAPADRVTVIRAEGPVFCSGIDMRERLETPAKAGESPIEVVLHAIETYPLPVVGVVQGDAIAGGNELALHCDFVVASTAARFGMSLAQIGLAPTWFLTKKLMEVAGPVWAREMLLLGDPIPATRMHELNLIARAVPPGELEAAAAKIIDRLAANAPLSLRAMKAMMVRQMQFRDGIDHKDATDLVEAARKSADSREGMQARLEKRRAVFKGS
jgi:enoyl-CoA hydratase/carnithine racemase